MAPWQARYRKPISGSGSRAGSKGGAPGQGAKGQSSSEAEELLAFRHLDMEAANLPTYLKFKNVKKSDICVICGHGWP